MTNLHVSVKHLVKFSPPNGESFSVWYSSFAVAKRQATEIIKLYPNLLDEKIISQLEYDKSCDTFWKAFDEFNAKLSELTGNNSSLEIIEQDLVKDSDLVNLKEYVELNDILKTANQGEIMFVASIIVNDKLLCKSELLSIYEAQKWACKNIANRSLTLFPTMNLNVSRFFEHYNSKEFGKALDALHHKNISIKISRSNYVALVYQEQQ